MLMGRVETPSAPSTPMFVPSARRAQQRRNGRLCFLKAFIQMVTSASATPVEQLHTANNPLKGREKRLRAPGKAPFSPLFTASCSNKEVCLRGRNHLPPSESVFPTVHCALGSSSSSGGVLPPASSSFQKPRESRSVNSCG